jgi:hypothetical protein
VKAFRASLSFAAILALASRTTTSDMGSSTLERYLTASGSCCPTP